MLWLDAALRQSGTRDALQQRLDRIVSSSQSASSERAPFAPMRFLHSGVSISRKVPFLLGISFWETERLRNSPSPGKTTRRRPLSLSLSTRTTRRVLRRRARARAARRRSATRRGRRAKPTWSPRRAVGSHPECPPPRAPFRHLRSGARRFRDVCSRNHCPTNPRRAARPREDAKAPPRPTRAFIATHARAQRSRGSSLSLSLSNNTKKQHAAVSTLKPRSLGSRSAERSSVFASKSALTVRAERASRLAAARCSAVLYRASRADAHAPAATRAALCERVKGRASTFVAGTKRERSRRHKDALFFFKTKREEDLDEARVRRVVPRRLKIERAFYLIFRVPL